MRANVIFFPLIAGAVALFTLGSTLTGCSGCGSGTEASAMDSTATGAGAGAANDATAGGANGAGSGTNTAGHGSDSAGYMDTRTTDMSAGDASKTILTPAEERTKTGEEMRGLRAILKAELDGVRASLGKGGTPEEKEVHKTRAAELAQGLERIDRAIKAIDEADDVSWGTIRESQIKEAGEVRAWMAKYGMNVSA